jgi:hypothetical protein
MKSRSQINMRGKDSVTLARPRNFAYETIEKRLSKDNLFSMVGVKGLEPSTSRSQTARATSCATPRNTQGNRGLIIEQ